MRQPSATACLLVTAAFSALPLAVLLAADDDDAPPALVRQATSADGKSAKTFAKPGEDSGLSSADDFLGGTEVCQTQEKGEFELQGNLFLGRNVQIYSGEIEYGVTDQFMISLGTGYGRVRDVADAGDSEESGSSGPTSTWTGEFELRYRLAHQRAWPCDIAFSVDVAPQFVRGQATQWAAEPRVILQRSFGPFTATANIGAELGRYSTLDLSGGCLYQLGRYAALGGEILYDSRDQELSGLPQIFLLPTRQLTIVLGYTFCNVPSLNTWDASLRFDF